MSGPATDASSYAVSDLGNAWSAVQSNPDDFSAWEQLIRHAESADGGVNATMEAENANGLRQVYDSFLEKFPLCFGYWKKYADAENTISGPDIAEKVPLRSTAILLPQAQQAHSPLLQVFERGVAAIENSVDLWAHYCDFMSHKGANDAEMRA
jgi:pre-mRNA-processing factor 39